MGDGPGARWGLAGRQHRWVPEAVDHRLGVLDAEVFRSGRWIYLPDLVVRREGEVHTPDNGCSGQGYAAADAEEMDCRCGSDEDGRAMRDGGIGCR